MQIELTIYHIDGTERGSTTTIIRPEAKEREANRAAEKAFRAYCRARGMDRHRHYWVWAV